LIKGIGIAIDEYDYLKTDPALSAMFPLSIIEERNGLLFVKKEDK